MCAYALVLFTLCAINPQVFAQQPGTWGGPGVNILFDNIFRMGPVGIGTVVPARRLHVTEPNLDLAPLRIANGNPNFSAEFSVGSRMAGSTGDLLFWPVSSNSGMAAYYRDAEDELRFGFGLNSSGNFGLGTTNPEIKLSVRLPNGDAFSSLASFRKDNAAGASSSMRIEIDPLAKRTFLRSDGATLELGAGPTRAHLSIFSNGNIGVSNTNPQARFDIFSDLSGYYGLLVTKTEGGEPIALFRDNQNQSDANWTAIGSDGGILSINRSIEPSSADYLRFWRADQSRAAIGLDNQDNFAIMKGTSQLPALIVQPSGKVGINTSYVPTDYLVAMDGKLICEELTVQMSENWPDYVFAEEYNLMPITEVAEYIDEHKHLPGIPSAKEVKEEGIEVGDMQRRMMEKIEELTLYVIELKQEIATLKEEKNRSPQN